MHHNFTKPPFKLKLNQITKPLKSQFTYHIIKNTQQPPKYHHIKPHFKKQLLNQKQPHTNQIQTILNKFVKHPHLK
ncbi:peptidylprolyl isomerase, partial [Bacillus pumilus]|uniref:peptidylprolyl isomerase n=1 Tax=Bacillus pumilus TaxID=1408 RepID=UPI00370497D7